jgi:hypothetical protein
MPSRESSLRNLKKAQANGSPPRPWRSRAESRAIRMITWQSLLDHGPWCSGRALARWLGVSHTYVQKFSRTLSKNDGDFLRQVRYFGAPSIDGLRRAREESGKQRERGLLRTQPRWKWVEFNIGRTIVRDRVATKPNAATLAAQNPVLADAPTLSGRTNHPPNYTAMYMWHLRVNAERDKAMGRSRTGMNFRSTW